MEQCLLALSARRGVDNGLNPFRRRMLWKINHAVGSFRGVEKWNHILMRSCGTT